MVMITLGCSGTNSHTGRSIYIVHAHTHTHTHKHTYTHVYTHVYTRTHTLIHIQTTWTYCMTTNIGETYIRQLVKVYSWWNLNLMEPYNNWHSITHTTWKSANTEKNQHMHNVWNVIWIELYTIVMELSQVIECALHTHRSVKLNWRDKIESKFGNYIR